MTRSAGPLRLLLAALGVLWLASAAAQSEDTSRGVHIIGEPPADAAPVPSPPPAPPSGVPPVPTLHAPAPPPANPPPLQQAAPSPPVLLPPAPQPTPALAPALPPRPQPGQAALSPIRPQDLGAMQASLKMRNPAGVKLDILPRAELQVGEKIALRVATRKQGYLVLVDVDTAGKLTQIYPNRRSLLLAKDGQDTSNLIKPGRPLTIPEIGNPYAGFEFVASPPTGVAMIVAILSDRPVQMLDLPDVPPSLVGQGGAVGYLTDWTRNLRIARAGSGGFEEAEWSFDAKLYVVR
jgi:hypothetical protein